MDHSQSIEVRNPHAALATLLARPKDVLEVAVTSRPQEAWDEVQAVARRNGIRVRSVGASKQNESRGKESGGGREGSFVKIRQKESISLEAMVKLSPKKGFKNRVFFMLDQLQDPHNVGAIFRSASFFGLTGIFMTSERSASLSGVVYEVASGGVETVPYCEIGNLSAAVKVLKENGIWILGTSEHAKNQLKSASLDRDWVIVLGNEETGMRRLTSELCDDVIQVRPYGDGVTSLNVSVSAGIFATHFLNK